jgi:hypothetical protein
MRGAHTYPLTLIQLIQIFWSKEETVLSLTIRDHLVFAHRGERLRERDRVVDPDPDPYWIRIQLGLWIRIRIRIQEGKNDPQK